MTMTSVLETTDILEPPHDLNAEEAVLAVAMFGEPGALDILAALPLDTFYYARHKYTAEIMQDMHRRGDPVTPNTVHARATALGLGGRLSATWLLGLYQNGHSAAGAAYLADILRRLRKLRTLDAACVRARQRIHTPGAIPDDEDFAALANELGNVIREVAA